MWKLGGTFYEIMHLFHTKRGIVCIQNTQEEQNPGLNCRDYCCNYNVNGKRKILKNGLLNDVTKRSVLPT